MDRRESVGAGTLIGRITDAFGRVLHEVRAPFGGVMLYVVATPPVSQGEPLGDVAQVTESLPPDLAG